MNPKTKFFWYGLWIEIVAFFILEREMNREIHFFGTGCELKECSFLFFWNEKWIVKPLFWYSCESKELGFLDSLWSRKPTFVVRVLNPYISAWLMDRPNHIFLDRLWTRKLNFFLGRVVNWNRVFFSTSYASGESIYFLPSVENRWLISYTVDESLN